MSDADDVAGVIKDNAAEIKPHLPTIRLADDMSARASVYTGQGAKNLERRNRMKKRIRTVQPLLYLTRDRDGLHLWFAQGKPQKKNGIFEHPLAASKTRLPLSWYDGLIDMDTCQEYDPIDIFSGMQV